MVGYYKYINIPNSERMPPSNCSCPCGVLASSSRVSFDKGSKNIVCLDKFQIYNVIQSKESGELLAFT